MAVMCDRAYLEIDGTEIPAQEVTRAIELDGHDTVKAMTRSNRAIGHKSGVVTFEVTAKIPVDEEGDDADTIERTMTNRDPFTTVIEYEGGRTRTIEDCWITSLSENAAHGDEVTLDVTIRGLTQGIN